MARFKRGGPKNDFQALAAEPRLTSETGQFATPLTSSTMVSRTPR
jgi:hypothetical protein